MPKEDKSPHTRLTSKNAEVHEITVQSSTLRHGQLVFARTLSGATSVFRFVLQIRTASMNYFGKALPDLGTAGRWASIQTKAKTPLRQIKSPRHLLIVAQTLKFKFLERKSVLDVSRKDSVAVQTWPAFLSHDSPTIVERSNRYRIIGLPVGSRRSCERPGQRGKNSQGDGTIAIELHPLGSVRSDWLPASATLPCLSFSEVEL